MYSLIKELVLYGIRTSLIDPSEEIYTRNLLLDLMGERGYEEPEKIPEERQLAEILEELTDAAARKGLIEDSVTCRDLFDTRIMNCLTPRPAQVRRDFAAICESEGSQAATDWYYRFSRDTNYIRRDRAKKDVRWKVDSEYGRLDITINLAKPEKDPRAIAAAAKMEQTGYPACQLCRENEGYAGHEAHPARQNHRIIPVRIEGEDWSWQYSPYGYYNEHCIVFNDRHVPMKVDRSCFAKLLGFIRQYPHYFLGSNADLPIVGGSILSHEHFQGGRYEFAMAMAPVEIPYTFPGFEDVECGIVRWPLSVVRLRGSGPQRLVDLAERVLDAWRSYTDEEAFVYAMTEGEPHNTITPIARFSRGSYELDLVLRNNITTQERPLGVYHPALEHHHIKKENIGLIEVMGLAVLPARLKGEMDRLADVLVRGRRESRSEQEMMEDMRCDEDLAAHADWAGQILRTYERIDERNVQGILREEIGRVFVHVLEDAGVFKWDDAGHRAFLRFLESV